MKGYEYWDGRYKVGKIDFIRKTKTHPQRSAFVNWVKDVKEIKSILEVGPGEMVEYQMLRKLRPSIDYSIADVATIFLKNCQKRYPQVGTYNLGLEQLDQIDRTFDCVYVSCVFEHAANVQKAIRNCINLGDYFHFVFFKWSWTTGGLMSAYSESKGFYSTYFNIWDILTEIKKYGNIEYSKVIHVDGLKYNLEQYQEMMKTNNGKVRRFHRNGEWLAIHGRRKK